MWWHPWQGLHRPGGPPATDRLALEFSCARISPCFHSCCQGRLKFKWEIVTHLTHLPGKSVVLKSQWLKPVWDTEQSKSIIFSRNIMEKVHFILINSTFKTAALSEKGLLYVDDKAGCIQISATKQASLLKDLSAWSTQQWGSQQEHAPG